jgi:hypothetical protein
MSNREGATVRTFKTTLCVTICTTLLATSFAHSAEAPGVEQWGMFEITLNGPSTGNPFTEVSLSAEFTSGGIILKPDGFYDGAGVYTIRCMPTTPGTWSYLTHSNVPALDGKRGSFTCLPPSQGNHGPVRVKDTYHFAYADGLIYNQIGTTCYYWNNQPAELEDRTLSILKSQPFNKLRMAVFPLTYQYIPMPPVYHVYDPLQDHTRFNPAYWRHLETLLDRLRDLGIEADVILFHPYDKWGYARMDYDANVLYLKYAVARLAAFRNVWWSLANEFNLLGWSSDAWEKYGKLVQAKDPYGHLRSIHHVGAAYDNSKPWVTHASLQIGDLSNSRKYRERWRKRVVVDEAQYEGNLMGGAGGQTGQELTHRFWLGTINGIYVGHSESYADPQNIIWWSTGGVLKGTSPPRIAFLKKLMDASPPQGFEPVDGVCARKGELYYLCYYGKSRSSTKTFTLPSTREYRVDILDTWGMTVTPVSGTYKGTFTIPMPNKQYLAVRIYSDLAGGK